MKKPSRSATQAAKPTRARTINRILAIDVGGSGVKMAVVDARGKFLGERQRVKTPLKCTPDRMVRLIVEMARAVGPFDRVSIGFPGMVRNGVVLTAPNLGTEQWSSCALASIVAKKLGRPTQLHNDADVQGLAAIRGKGLELVCTLGTGLGTAWFRDGELLPHMDLSHMSIAAKDDFDHYIGEKALKKIGKKAWNNRLKKLIAMLQSVFFFDHLYLGGGNSRIVNIDLPKNVSVVSNKAGMEGGAFVWLPKGNARIHNRNKN